jgi:UDP-N-acetylmuramate--alanine ligase
MGPAVKCEEMLDLESGDAFHLAGVAGIGMSALAQALVHCGYSGSGSDRLLDIGKGKASGSAAVLDSLEAAGVKLVPQDGSGVVEGSRAVVVSSAIEDDNPDIAAANLLNVPIVHRSTVLAALTAGKRCVAVSGTSGKSTVTAMIGWVLCELGEDPTVINGAILRGWADNASVGNSKLGSSDLWIIEADESDKSLLAYRPDWAVITNVSLDHFPLEETEELFDEFRSLAITGIVDLTAEKDILDALDIQANARGSAFRYKDMMFSISVLGRHNVENALCAVMVCEKLGFDLEAIAGALRSFPGIHRRLEQVGSVSGVPVIDDYAHNPAKINAAWTALSPYYKRVLAIWRPHGFGPLVAMMDELLEVFGEMLKAGNKLYVLPVYDAGGTADRSVNSDELVERLKAIGVEAKLVENYDDVAVLVAEEAGRRDVVLTMGARDPGLPELAEKIVSSIEERVTRL